MVRNALTSILRANEHHQDWELAFIDDSSPTPGRPVCEEILCDHLDKVRFYHTGMTLEEKMRTGGMVGKTMNQAIRESDADIVIMLCDDDELHPEYLRNLSEYFETHEDEEACYSHVILYNPVFEKSEHAPLIGCALNHKGLIDPHMKLDASQVAWRPTVRAKFDENRTKCLDARFYQQLPLLMFSGFVGQYKGVHITQLGYWETKDVWTVRTIDTRDGELLTPVVVLEGLVKKYIDLGNGDEARRICEKAIELHPAHTNLYLLLREASDV